MNIAKKAQRYLDTMEVKNREDKSIVCFKIEKINCKEYQDLVNVLSEVKLSLDSVMMFAYQSLNTIIDSNAKSEEQAHEAIDAMEPDVYTGRLTAWLAENAYHVYYLTDAIKDYSAEDGFQALAIAQQLAMQEVGHALVDMLASK